MESARSEPRTTSPMPCVGVVDHDREVVGERAVAAAHDEVVDDALDPPSSRSENATEAPSARTRSAGGRPEARFSASSAALSRRHVPGYAPSGSGPCAALAASRISARVQ